jgi:hypothetical protein
MNGFGVRTVARTIAARLDNGDFDLLHVRQGHPHGAGRACDRVFMIGLGFQSGRGAVVRLRSAALPVLAVNGRRIEWA